MNEKITLPPKAEAKAFLRDNFEKIAFGECAYSGPCAIGLLMTPEQRDALVANEMDRNPIASLVSFGVVQYANPGDDTFYERLQSYVDDEDHNRTRELLN